MARRAFLAARLRVSCQEHVGSPKFTGEPPRCCIIATLKSVKFPKLQKFRIDLTTLTFSTQHNTLSHLISIVRSLLRRATGSNTVRLFPRLYSFPTLYSGQYGSRLGSGKASRRILPRDNRRPEWKLSLVFDSFHSYMGYLWLSAPGMLPFMRYSRGRATLT